MALATKPWHPSGRDGPQPSMSLATASLWEALGRPPPDDLVGGRRAASWKHARRSLQDALQTQGCHVRVISWRALWAACHADPPPLAVTWRVLCSPIQVGELAVKLNLCGIKKRFGIVYWNVRWFIRHDTKAAAAKRGAICRALNKNNVVCLSETHWSNADAATWAACFPAATLYHTAATPGPQGGPAGGTAILVPHKLETLSHTVLVDGCALLVEVRDRETLTQSHVLSLYFPPNRRQEIMGHLLDHPIDTARLFMGGDLNFDLYQPRTPDEHDLHQHLHQWLSSHNSTLLDGQTATRKQRGQEATLDGVAVPTTEAWQWQVTVTWNTGTTSDHAAIHCSLASGSSKGTPPCTPAVMKALPDAAIQDLRTKYHKLSHMFGLEHGIGNDVPPPTHIRPPSPGNLPAHVPEDLHSSQDAAAVQDCNTSTVPWNESLALRGYVYLDSMLTSWWKTWQKTAQRLDMGAILRGLMRHSADLISTPTSVSEWYQHFTQDALPSSLSRDDIQRLINLYEHHTRATARHRPAKPYRVHSTLRIPLAMPYALGRRVYKPRIESCGLRMPDGTLSTDPGVMDTLLWNSRKDIWTKKPPESPAGTPLLDHYFATREPLILPDRPGPVYHDIAQHVLHNKGSAAGVDNRPYEVYHQGVGFTTHLLAQAAYVAHEGASEICAVIGPSIDLGIWIPKKDGADTTNGQRPLQLPTTLRRLYGCYFMSVVGPVVEPLFSPQQTAIKGGECGHNIKRVYAHLLDTSKPTPPTPTDLWHQVLGPVSHICVDICHRCTDTKLTCMPAVVFADQSKAFERVGTAWVLKVMQGWKMPAWVQHSLLNMMEGRSVRTRVKASLSKPRQLACGTGMGGPASPFTWNLAYDPIIYGLSTAIIAFCPTYVDDLAGLIWGPQHAMMLIMFLLAAGHVSGLRIDMHTCMPLHFQTDPDAVVQLLYAFPVEVTAGADGNYILTGLPGPLAIAILAPLLGPVWTGRAQVTPHTCRCSTKSVIVPASGIEEWRNSLALLCPFGAGCVVPRAPYLGVQVGTTSTTLQQIGCQWTKAAMASINNLTWGPVILKAQRRAQALQGITSIAMRAIHWDVYIITLLTYPTQLCAPPPHVLKNVLQLASQFLCPSGWVHAFALSGLGMRFRVRGTPRQPEVSLLTSAVLGYLRIGRWAPWRFTGGNANDGAAQHSMHELTGVAACWLHTRNAFCVTLRIEEAFWPLNKYVHCLARSTKHCGQSMIGEDLLPGSTTSR